MGAGPRLRHCGFLRVEQSAGRVFINTFIAFSPRAVDVVKYPWSNFFHSRPLNIDYFTLHYMPH